MAEGWSATAGNAALTTLVATYPWIKLHIGAPGSAGTASPAVETDRVQSTWGTASGGTVSNTAALTWTAVGGTEDYTHYTAWSASTAGTFGFSGTITANAVTTGDDFTIPIGDLDVALTLAT